MYDQEGESYNVVFTDGSLMHVQAGTRLKVISDGAWRPTQIMQTPGSDEWYLLGMPEHGKLQGTAVQL